MKIYQFTYTDGFGNDSDVSLMLKSIDSVSDLRIPFTRLCFIKSTDTANAISKKIIQLKPQLRFFISEVTENRQGWLPKDIWEFIREED
jgi:hypothetical protein